MAGIGRALGEVARNFSTKQWVGTALSVAGLLVGLVAAFTNETAASIVAAVALFLVVAVTLYTLYVRERYGGIYEILTSQLTWDIEQPDRARLIKVNNVRFIQNNVLAIPDYIWGEGAKNVAYKCDPGMKVAEFDDVQRRCAVIALDRMYKRDEELSIKIERDASNSFPDPEREWIELKPLAGTPQIDLTIRWPANKPASKVWLTISNDRRNKRTTNRVDDELQWDNGRPRFKRHIPRPSHDEVYRIEWEW